jgi:glyoxylase-like metal-dependent hydrolase (beta-lactamase superfamily II)
MEGFSVYPILNNHGFLKNFNYLIMENENSQAVLVDPAGNSPPIIRKIADAGAALQGILLTHHHNDHVNLAEFITKKYNVPVFMSRTEVDAYGFNCPNLIALEGEDIFDCGKISIEPFFTPGHTRGSACYKIGANLFTGDTLFIEGCGICHGNGASPEEMYFSMRSLVKKIPEDTRIYPGHSYGKAPGMSFGYLLDNNIYLNINKIEQFVAFRMRKGQTGWLNFKIPDLET